MKQYNVNRDRERGSATIKFLIIMVVIVLAANAGYHYVPVAYEGASFRQEMDTAVVKGLAASGQMRPLDVVQASILRAARDNNVPPDAVVQVKPVGNIVEAHVAYSKNVAMLPFGLYNYKYDFNYVARPTGYLLKQ